MSTHTLDVSGARALTTRTNDPASTYASTPAKQGDDVMISVSGGREFRIGLSTNARLQKRSWPQRRPVRDADGNTVYEDRDGVRTMVTEAADPMVGWVLVLQGGATMFLRASNALFADDDPAKPTYESYPHTQVQARRWKEPFSMLETGDLLEEHELGELLEA